MTNDHRPPGGRLAVPVGPTTPGTVAYLSPEFALDQALPIYSGGLGVLAGDHLKTAADLGIPIVGLGLLYRGGYFQQVLDAEGRQTELPAPFDPVSCGLELATGADGLPARIAIQLHDSILHARIWLARHGGVRLYLLDSDVPENEPTERDVTDRLYGGDGEHRLRQEILLGIGGVKALTALAIQADVFHSNEGHAGFMGLERIRVLVEDHGVAVDEAIEAVRATTVFTTHTPVPAGIDRFPASLVARYLGPGGVPTGLSLERVLALGSDPADPGVFDMAALGIRLAGRVNGVSRLHGSVSRLLFARYWEGAAPADVPITSITNGVHGPTWVGPPMQGLLHRTVGAGWANGDGDWSKLRLIEDADLWQVRGAMRATLIDGLRVRVRGQAAEAGAGALDPAALTIGFARRVPTYKRLTLMLRERDRLVALLTDDERPLQLVVAGKAHPNDGDGKRLLAEFGAFAALPELRGRVVLVSDYDMALGALLTQGSDVWLNTPRRPHEACGTSGMKAALNGGLNLSILDGWWDELYDGTNGWEIPSADESLDEDHRDALEAAALLDLLESVVVPGFYDRPAGLPTSWLDRVRASLVTIGPEVLASRMLRDYVRELYLPAAADGRAERTAAPSR